ncbi:phage portal protein [Evansella tamaricis]|uniref:Phage portal protein n=1 Tax=Evansella tamaricis TaxID=2069301 RepID=A0ABS6JBL8_9BACI|nr:phage portal protein [Evansella tamaricis]MBU9711073.1 phage portal protein [Evansella tamaricis]
MFRNLISKLKGVLARMGLIKGLKKVTDLKDVITTDEFYVHLSKWIAIYKGYHPDWHDLKYTTLNGRKKRRMRSMRMGKVVASEMANLVFNEKCSISIGSKNGGTDEFEKNILNVLSKNAFYKKFQDFLEFMFAMGGMVIKAYVIDDKIKLSYVTADCFIPVADDGRQITEGIFVNESRKGDKYYTHLEWHLWENGVYVVRNELYESHQKGELGVKIPLDTLYQGLEEEVTIQGLKRSLFVYFKPNIANSVDLDSKLGIPLFADALDTLYSLDTAFDSFNREFRLGKKRITVPTSAIQTVVDEHGMMHRYFDADDEVYEAFNFEGDKQEAKEHVTTLRVDEHISAINTLLEILAFQTGFSPGTFTFDGQGLKTATEVVSENSKTYRSRSGHITLVEEGLKDLIQVIADLGALYDLFTVPTDFETKANFDDSIAEDRDTNATYWIKLVQNEVASKLQAIMKIQKVTEEDAVKILNQIKSENQTVGADQVDWFGSDG